MRGVLKYNEPLAPYTSWRVGGPADRYFRPADSGDLAEFFKTIKPEESITWLGLGSNVLIPDAGIRGVVIHTLMPASFNGIQIIAIPERDTVCLRVEAGITCAKLAKYCAKAGLLGGEFFAGIPGTVGGALAMNAGAWGGETWNLITQVEVIDRFGQRKMCDHKDYAIGYRSVSRVFEGLEEWFIAGYFEFERGDPTAASAKIKTLLKERTQKQPIGVFSCGSVFKNPEGDHAGRLIEASQLKGFRIGGAEVSSKHANFILNLGNARAEDIKQLIQHIQAVVWEKHQIRLEPEVRML